MLKTPVRLRRNANLKRSKSCRPRIEWMEPRTLLSPPTITGLNPTTGSEAGGTSVAITGTGFIGATVVDFGNTAATDLVVVHDTLLMVDSPAGTGTVDVTVTTPAGTSATSPADDFTYEANQVPAITSAASTAFAIGTLGTFTVTTTGFPTSALSETGALPLGVTFVDNFNGTATLAGIPAVGTDGTYPLTITAANGVLPDATQSFTLTVGAAEAPVITSADSTTFTTGTAGTFTVTTTGTPTPALSETGALPSGVTFVRQRRRHGHARRHTRGGHRRHLRADDRRHQRRHPRCHPDLHPHRRPGAGDHQRRQHDVHDGHAPARSR